MFVGLECLGLFGVLLCCVGLCKGLVCLGGCNWRVGVTTCQLLWFGQSVQSRLGYLSGENMFFQWCPMYWVCQNLKSCMICTYNMHEAFQKWFESC